MTSLPVELVIPQLLDGLNRADCVILRAPTGAGKTTRVPPALLPFCSQTVLLLEPRRVAARAAARRMAFESQTPLGGRFGYHVRLDRKASRETRCLTLTPGILLRMLQDDPYLETVSVVVFDEFHERGIEADLALGLCRLLRESVRPDLKIVVMSATVDPKPISDYLQTTEIITSEGRTYPVEIHYKPKRPEQSLPEAMASLIRHAVSAHDGDVLAFLPGLGEIRKTAELIENLRDFEIMMLHGEMPPEQQDRALQKLERRKIVLATNIAETSVTVDGVTVVIDSGLARVQMFESAYGMNRLVLKPISRASADQRAGRAGRTQPGVAYRMWNEVEHRARPEQGEPEIRRVDLAGPLLQLIAMGESNPENFPWLDLPSPEQIRRGLELLEQLHFIHENKLTTAGEAAARLPVHPRLARMILTGASTGVAEAGAMAASLLSDRDPFERHFDHVIPTDSDLVARVDAMFEFVRNGKTDSSCGRIHRGAARMVIEGQKQFLNNVDNPTPTAQLDPDDALLKAIASAYPDRIAKRRAPADRRAVMVGGRGVKLGPMSGVNEAELFVAIDVDAAGADALVRMASMVKREWLDQDRIQTKQELAYDEKTDRIVARKRTRYLDILLDDLVGHVANEQEASEILKQEAVRRAIRPAADSPAGQFLIRFDWLKKVMPDLESTGQNQPELNFEQLLSELCQNQRSLKAVENGDWLSAIRNLLGYSLCQRIDREAPATLTMPTGSQIALIYQIDQPPILSVRIQELFGLSETPRIAGGRIAVLLHLLAPNFRPQQVTNDLASFWKNGYPIVRKELRGRYPKHSWPDDPLTAEPMRGAKRRVE